MTDPAKPVPGRRSHGARFHSLPVNEGTVTLVREPTVVPERIEAGGLAVVPYHAGATLAWRVGSAPRPSDSAVVR